MVCEVQFLMDWMIESKKRDHSIYEIVRTHERIRNVIALCKLYSNPDEELFALAIREDESGLSRFMINNPHFNYIPRTPGQSSLIHFLASTGKVKLVKLWLSAAMGDLSTSEKQKILNWKGKDDMTPLLYAAQHNRTEMVDFLFSKLGGDEFMKECYSPKKVEKFSKKAKKAFTQFEKIRMEHKKSMEKSKKRGALDKITFIKDVSRAKQIDDVLGRWELPPKDMRDAMLEMNEAYFSIHHITTLKYLCPTFEEDLSTRKMLKSLAPEELDTLEKAEVFWGYMATLRHSKERCALWEFKLEFDERVDDLQKVEPFSTFRSLFS